MNMNALWEIPHDTAGREVTFASTCQRAAVKPSEPNDLIAQLRACAARHGAIKHQDDSKFIQRMTGLRRASRSW